MAPSPQKGASRREGICLGLSDSSLHEDHCYSLIQSVSQSVSHPNHFYKASGTVLDSQDTKRQQTLPLLLGTNSLEEVRETGEG